MLVKKVCKQCGKNGYILRLNEKLLCPDCVDLENKEMTADEVVDELVNWYNDKGSLKKINALHKAHEAKNRRQEKNFHFVFGNYQKARDLERKGETDKALAIYLKLLKNNPPGTLYYTRPCIILEKKHEYAQAIEICDMAIKGIREDRFNADEEEFLHRKNRLLKKLEKDSIS